MQQGGSHQYGGSQVGEGVPPNSNHLPTTQPTAEAVPPINSRPPDAAANLEELAKFQDDEGGGEEAERSSGPPGNRWPREETLALIKIRTDMDATFRDATLKGPLWDEVSRKLAEQGYARSAKKCKEKFENVHKYYKRTKEGRAGRQDGKCYRFFAQLEALHNIGSGDGGGGGANHRQPSLAPPYGISGSGTQPVPLTSVAPLNVRPQPTPPAFGGGAVPTSVVAGAGAGLSFSLDSSSSSWDTSETDGENKEAGEQGGRKRKRRSCRGGKRKTMAFFNELMKQLMDQQEVMQQRFLETIDKREQDRMVREEAWRRQEMTRLAREQETVAQERAMSATRDTAIITLLQKITGQTIHLPQQKQQQQRQRQNADTSPPRPAASETAAMYDRPPEVGGAGAGAGADPASSRWPKNEVHALIQIRSGKESRYQEVGPKGQLWEEISSEMKQMGYRRSSKRCKEKWENINKYYKKTKDSNKKRPDDAKTCPYFHQLEALYRRKSLAGAPPPPNNQSSQLQEDVLPLSTLPPPPPNDPPADDERNGNGSAANNNNNNGGGGGTTTDAQTSNGDIPTAIFEEQSAGAAAARKPDDMVKELMAAGVDDYDKDSGNMDGAEDDEDEDEEEQKVAYKIEFQRPNVGGGASNGGGSQSSVAGRVPSSATAGSPSYMAIVQ